MESSFSACAAMARVWGVEVSRICSDIRLDGSPERVRSRMALEDGEGQRYVLEEVEPRLAGRKERVARTMEQVHRQGFSLVHPYLSVQGRHLLEIEGRLWMLRPYIEGVSLDRATYAAQAWRGEVLAEALIRLRSLAPPDAVSRFSLPDYVARVLPVLEQRRPGIVRELAPVLAFLRECLEPAYRDLAEAFCHGDFHPLNVVWGGSSLRAVIDWEFCGRKTECYDLALLLGCIGFDEPENLQGPLVCTLLNRVREGRVYHPESIALLLPVMVAIRIAWLREWVFRKARAAIKQEMEYLHLLMAFHHEGILGVPI